MLGALVVVFGGLYDVAASTQHTQWTYDFLETTFEQSVRRRARTVLAPPPGLAGAGDAEQDLWAVTAFVATRLPNTRDNLVAWIREPQRIDPDSAMPSLSVGAADAQDMAAYLEQLD